MRVWLSFILLSLSGTLLAADRVVTLTSPGSPMVLIRGGHFLMGSSGPEIDHAQDMCEAEPQGMECDPDVFGNEIAQHTVGLKDFWIDRHEVTYAAYKRCVGAGVCSMPGYAAAHSWHKSADVPMTLVSWYDAQAYCKWKGLRLPTEAEFERAAKGWNRRTFPWGNVFNPMIANHGRLAPNDRSPVDGYLELAPVGSFPSGRTPEGVADLAGNVEEWVFDWYAQRYPEADTVDPIGPDTGDTKVVRGGSYIHGRAWLRSAARGNDLPSRRRPHRGFRCAKTYLPKKK